MNSGSEGNNPSVLTLNEYDGYLLFDNPDTPKQDDWHLAWHVLPRQAAKVKVRPGSFPGGGDATLRLINRGVGTAQLDAYSLLAVSPKLPEGDRGGQSPTPDIKGVGVNTFPVPAGFCSDQPSFIWAFAIDTWEDQSHVLPVSHIISLDIDQDGSVDAEILNRDLAASPPGFNQIGDGRQVTWALDYVSGSATAFFFAEHATNTGNTVLYICGEQVGLSGADLLATNVDVSFFAQDFYFGGPGDTVEGLTVTPLGEQYVGFPSDDIPGNTRGTIDIVDYGPWPGNSPELGIMLLTNGDRGSGARGGATDWTDTVYIGVKGAAMVR
jgi:hypothetical protein